MLPLRFIVTLAVVVCWGTLELPAQDPERKRVHTYIDSLAPRERTVGERVRSVDAVAIVRVVGDGVPRLIESRTGSRQPGVVTDYQLEILDVIKAHPLAGVTGARIPVVQPGGEADWGREYRVVTQGAPHVFVRGETYLVFLETSRAGTSLLVTSTDVFSVRGQQIAANRSSQLTRYAQELTTQALSDAVESMKRAAEAAPTETTIPGR